MIGNKSDKDLLAWRKAQYALGKTDGLAGRQGRYADKYYQRGYRVGGNLKGTK